LELNCRRVESAVFAWGISSHSEDILTRRGTIEFDRKCLSGIIHTHHVEVARVVLSLVYKLDRQLRHQ
jgi:hypothetical protein